MRPGYLGLACWLWIAGCPGGDDDAGERPDAGTSVPDAGFVIDPPAPPASPADPALPAVPELLPCPSGWREVDAAEGLRACDPWPAGGHDEGCADHEAHFPGEPGCARIGTECPADGWPAELAPLAGESVVHVRADAAGGGTGTREAPFATVREALGAASGPTLIALAAGTYDEPVGLPGNVRIWGACAERTVIAPTEVSTAPTVTALGDGGVLRNLTLAGARIALRVDGPRRVVLEDVITLRASTLAWQVAAGGRVEATSISIRDTQPGTDGNDGTALDVQTRGVVTIDRGEIAGNRDIAVILFDPGTSLSLGRVSLRGTAARPDGRFGRGINVESGAALTLVESAIERNRGMGVFAATDSTVHVRDTVIRDTEGGRSQDGRGLSVQGNTALDVRRLWASGNRSWGIYASDGSHGEIADVIVTGTRPDVDGRGGRGLELRSGADVTLRRVALAGNADIGLHVLDTGTRATAEDLSVRDNAGDASGYGGRGVEASAGASLTASRVLIERVLDLGVVCVGGTAGLPPGATVCTLRDLTVRDVGRSPLTGAFGRGVGVLGTASLEVERLRVERTHEVAIGAALGSSLVVRDATVLDTAGAPDGRLGRALNVQEASTATLERALFERNRETAIVAIGGSTLRASDLVVRDVAPGALIQHPGRVLDCEGGSSFEVDRAAFERSSEIAVFASGDGTVVGLRDVVVRDTAAREIEGDLGLALHVQLGAEASLTRAEIVAQREAGLVAFGAGTRLSVSHVLVRDNEGRPVDGAGGTGLYAVAGASAMLDSVMILRAREVGLGAFDEGTLLRGDRVAVLDTLARACAVETCAEFPAGIGVTAQHGAAIELTDFTIARSALCGVQLATGGTVDLHRGVIQDNPIGANIQTEGFDPRRLTDEVAYRGNDRNLDSDVLPVPETEVPEVMGIGGVE